MQTLMRGIQSGTSWGPQADLMRGLQGIKQRVQSPTPVDSDPASALSSSCIALGTQVQRSPYTKQLYAPAHQLVHGKSRQCKANSSNQAGRSLHQTSGRGGTQLFARYDYSVQGRVGPGEGGNSQKERGAGELMRQGSDSMNTSVMTFLGLSR